MRELTLRPEGGALPHAPGSHMQVQLLVHGRPQVRSYSLVAEPDGQTYTIAVKRLDAGRGGSLAMWQLAPGDRLRISAPMNHFPLAWDAPAWLLVAGGIGITPLVRMAQALASKGPAVRMLYGVRTADELAYADTLAAALGDRLHTVVGAAMDLSAAIASLPAGGHMMVCGPAPMLEAARRAWQKAGRPAADLRFETFGSSGHLPPQTFRVQVPRHGLDIQVPSDVSLLDALEAAGVPALSDCRRGECGLCALNVLAVEGSVDHRDVYLSPQERQANQRICACVSRVVGVDHGGLGLARRRMSLTGGAALDAKPHQQRHKADQQRGIDHHARDVQPAKGWHLHRAGGPALSAQRVHALDDLQPPGECNGAHQRHERGHHRLPALGPAHRGNGGNAQCGHVMGVEHAADEARVHRLSCLSTSSGSEPRKKSPSK